MSMEMSNVYENKPNKEALEQQREKYLNEAVKALFAYNKKIGNPGSIWDISRWDIASNPTKYVLDFLKLKHGIDGNSSTEKLQEFNDEYSEQLIIKAIEKIEKR